MKFNIKNDLLQTMIPSNQWLVKDTNKAVIRSKSLMVGDVEHLNQEEELCMKKLIDFVRYSQDPTINLKTSEDHLRPAVGLAAPQIGVNKALFYTRFEWDLDNLDDFEEIAAINPKIISRSSQLMAIDGGEGCLSVDVDHDGFVPRNYKINVEYYDYLKRKTITETLRGYKAIVFQHEIEHLDGMLYYDHINQENPEQKDPNWLYI